jgi:hypothetical protein
MQKTLENLSSVTLFFFIVLGGLHMSSAFLLAEGLESSNISLLFNALDLPFLMVALLYGSSRLALAMEEATEKGKPVFVLCSVFSAVVLAGALYINFAFPDVNLL